MVGEFISDIKAHSSDPYHNMLSEVREREGTGCRGTQLDQAALCLWCSLGDKYARPELLSQTESTATSHLLWIRLLMHTLLKAPLNVHV